MKNNTVKSSVNSKYKILNISNLVLSLVAHVAIVVLAFTSIKYYRLESTVFFCLLGIFICLLAVLDIVLFVGVKYRDVMIKVSTTILSVLLLVVGSAGSYYVNRVNKTVDKVLDNSGTDQYEIVGGVFSCYTSEHSFSDISQMKSVSNLKIGVLYDEGVGTGSLAKDYVAKENVDASYYTFYTTDDLLSALVSKDDPNHVDVAVFPTSYRQRMMADEEVDYSQYLENIVDFYAFEDKVKTGENENANKDLSAEPFNILLIGFAPEDEAMTYGLADSIIVATVNPQTFTVSMTSIARDSYVPISCYGGSSDKINAARGTSRACLMQTVGDLVDLDIDYYMEVNFLGVVQIVDALGGIVINNPVEFVGQTASGIRGEYTVLVPAGEEVVADGEMALAFARERHAMPGGDFDRQKHQQEVIAAIVSGLLDMRDVNSALKVMEAAGNNISTNLSLDQLTGVFKYLISAKNTMGISTFNMIDIQSMRITGYSSWTYNYSMRLPLWIYKLYNGSIQEAKDRIDDVMNNHSKSDIKQNAYMKFFFEYPYSRGKLYSTSFNEAQVHEELPAYYPYLTKYNYQEAMQWAANNGVNLQVTFISPDSPNYIASMDGMVVDQNPRQGALVSEYRTGSITVMGNQDPNYVPTFTVENCNDESSCIAFANSHGISYEYGVKSITDTSSQKEGAFAGTNYKNGEQIKKNQTLVIYKYKMPVVVPDFANMTYADYVAKVKSLGIYVNTKTINEGATPENNGKIVSVTPGVGSVVDDGSTIVVNVYEYKKVEEKPEGENQPEGESGEHNNENNEGGEESGGDSEQSVEESGEE